MPPDRADIPEITEYCDAVASAEPHTNNLVRCWSGARCRLFAYGPADAIVIPKPHHLLPRLNPDWFYFSGTGLPILVLAYPCCPGKEAVKRVQ